MVEMNSVMWKEMGNRKKDVKVEKNVGERKNWIEESGNEEGLGEGNMKEKRIKIEDKVEEVILRSKKIEINDRIEKMGERIMRKLKERWKGRDLKGEKRRVKVMVREVDKGRIKEENREERERKRKNEDLDKIMEKRNILIRKREEEDIRLKDEIVEVMRLKDDIKEREMKRKKRMIIVGVIDLRREGDRLKVWKMRREEVGLKIELEINEIEENVEVKLENEGDDGMKGILVRIEEERRILGRKKIERNENILMVGIGIRIDRDLDKRIRELNEIKDKRIKRIEKSIESGGLIEERKGKDVEWERLIDVLKDVGVNMKNKEDKIKIEIEGVLKRKEIGKIERIDEGEGKRKKERIVNDIEWKNRKRWLIRRLKGGLGLSIEVDKIDGRKVGRRRKELKKRVEKRMKEKVIERGKEKDRMEIELDSEIEDKREKIVISRNGELEIGLNRWLIDIERKIDKILKILLRIVRNIGRNLKKSWRREDGEIKGKGINLDKIEEKEEIVLREDRKMKRKWKRKKERKKNIKREVEVGKDIVNIVEEENEREVVILRMKKKGLGMGIKERIGVEKRNREVEKKKRKIKLNSEVKVERSVDDVEEEIIKIKEMKESGSRRRGDSDKELMIMINKVNGRRKIVGLEDIVVIKGIEKNEIGNSSIEGVDVRNDKEIEVVLDFILEGNDSRYLNRFRRLKEVMREGEVGLRNEMSVLKIIKRRKEIVRRIKKIKRKEIKNGGIVKEERRIDEKEDGKWMEELWKKIKRKMIGWKKKEERKELDVRR